MVNLLRQLHFAPLADKEQAMALTRQWEHPHLQAAGACLLRISCAFPVFEPAPLPPGEVAQTVRLLLQLPVMTIFHLRRRISSLFYGEWRRVPWVVEEMDHASNLLDAALVLKDTYPAARV